MVLYYLIKYDVIEFSNISELTNVLQLINNNFQNTYEYINNTNPHNLKYKLDETIEKNYGIKTIRRLIKKAYNTFPVDEVSKYFEKIDLLHCIASICCYGEINQELVENVIAIIDMLLDNKYDLNAICWKNDVEKLTIGRTAIYFATNTQIIEHLMLKHINFDMDIFNFAFCSISDFYFYEQLFKKIFGVPYQTVIDENFDTLGDVLIDYFAESIKNTYLYFNQFNLAKYERYGILKRISDKQPMLYQINSGKYIIKLFNHKLGMTDIFDKEKFDKFVSDVDSFDVVVKNISDKTFKHVIGQKMRDVYVQYMIFNDNFDAKIKSYVQMLDMTIQNFPVIDQSLIDKYRFNLDSKTELLSKLAQMISLGKADEYMKLNNKHFIYNGIHGIEHKYQKYIDMYSINAPYNQLSIDYLNKIRKENPEYYEIINFWLFGKYQDFNEKIQTYEKSLTYDLLKSIENIQEYDSYYRSVVLNDVIYGAPRPQNKLITYRGVKDNKIMPHYRYNIGDNVVFTRFTSITQNYDVAFRFAKNTSEYIITIIVPPNSVCINLVTSENEIVLPRYAVLRYIGNDTLIYIGYNLTSSNKSTKSGDFVPFVKNYLSLIEEYTNEYKDIKSVVFDKMDMRSQIIDIDEASENGRIDDLNKSLRQQFTPYTKASMNVASANGHVDVLEWWKNSGLELKYTAKAIKVASLNGHIDVLEWWKNSGLKLKYYHLIIEDASNYGNIDVLEWWKKSGLELTYNYRIIDNASENGRVDMLEWWKNSGLELKYSQYAIDNASEQGHINILEWWKNSGLILQYTKNAMNTASNHGNVDVLKWWKNSGLKLKYSHYAIDKASEHGHINILEWWKNSGLKLKYTNAAMNYAISIDVLEWWKNSGLLLKYSKHAIDIALKYGRHDKVKWWEDSGLLK